MGSSSKSTEYLLQSLGVNAPDFLCQVHLPFAYLLASCYQGDKDTSVKKTFDRAGKIVVHLADTSYMIYLFHWPFILSFSTDG